MKSWNVAYLKTQGSLWYNQSSGLRPGNGYNRGGHQPETGNFAAVYSYASLVQCVEAGRHTSGNRADVIVTVQIDRCVVDIYSDHGALRAVQITSDNLFARCVDCVGDRSNCGLFQRRRIDGLFLTRVRKIQAHADPH